MLKRMNKKLALILVLTMLATMFVGVGAASAKSVNSVNKVVSIGTDFDGDTGVVLTVQEDADFLGHFEEDDTFLVTLPSGVKWNAAVAGDLGKAVAVIRSDQVLELTFDDGVTAGLDKVDIPMNIAIDGATGNVEVTVEALDSAVTGGSYLFARIADTGEFTASVSSVKKIAKSNTYGGDIELRETSVGAVGTGLIEINLKAPSNFEWWQDPAVSFAAGFGGATADAALDDPGDYDVDIDGRNATISYVAPARTQRGIIYIDTPIKALRDASFGDVEIDITGEDASGNDIVNIDLVVAEYADYGITAEVASVKELTSGKFDQVTDKITIKENISATMIAGRDITVEVPSWVKITDVKSFTDNPGTLVVGTPSVSGEKSYVDITIDAATSGTTKGKVEFKLEMSIQGDKEGDITATISGAGIETTELVVATASKPVTATVSEVKDVKIGVQSQAIGDVTITEGIKEAISKEYKNAPGAAQTGGVMVLKLTEGAKFAATPTVEVIEGNLEITAGDVQRSSDYTSVNVPIKYTGSKISSIKVSNIKVTLDRTIPEGELKLWVLGSAVVENHIDIANAGTLNPGEFSTKVAAAPVVANVVTPAPGEQNATALFTINSADYTINGVAQEAMDVAPFISGDRTYMPIRYVAYVLGIDDNNIVWDGINKTVTLMKGDKVVQLKVGSSTILVNGVAITMDVAPVNVAPGRVCLPIRFVAQAFGASVGWDAATQQVTVEI
ncbi:hypothetical protein ASZ90_020302 [hydrocarbon metagenome]|uniref:Copper amine oxidase-like N-terminal domain-containing protein n=1 Tax=hydrocarbon metagenome TaxID=938273 RepID=A0A0W8E1P0_9ZZZZ